MANDDVFVSNVWYNRTHRIWFGRSVKSLQKKFLLDRAIEYKTLAGYSVGQMIVYDRAVYEVMENIPAYNNTAFYDIYPDHAKLINDAADPVCTWEDWHLIPAERPSLPMPERKAVTYEMDGVDSVIDISESLSGYPVYQNRTDSWEFYPVNGFADWESRYSLMQQYLSGKKIFFIMEDDPGYYYEGRVWLETYEAGESYSTITMNYDILPYKRFITASDEQWLWDPFNFDNGIIQYPEFLYIPVNSLEHTIVPQSQEYMAEMYNEVLQKVKDGVYGNGALRWNRLSNAGYDTSIIAKHIDSGTPVQPSDFTSTVSFPEIASKGARFEAKMIGAMPVSPVLRVQFGYYENGEWNAYPFYYKEYQYPMDGTRRVVRVKNGLGRLYQLPEGVTHESGADWDDSYWSEDANNPGSQKTTTINGNTVPYTIYEPFQVCFSEVETGTNTEWFELFHGDNDMYGITMTNLTGMDRDISDKLPSYFSLKRENDEKLYFFLRGVGRASIVFRGGMF